MSVEMRSPSDLKVHSLNIMIYREHIDEDFKASIRRDGIQTPLTICKSSNPDLNDFIVCGRRRWYMAKDLKLKAIPCLTWECDDHLEFERRLILDNVRNETTVEERARMFDELKRIETEKAARRQKTTQRNGESPVWAKRPAPENIGENEENGRAADIAASGVGMGRKRAERAAEVVHSIDKLEAEGQPEAAAEVRHTLNNGSVSAAVRKVAEVTAPPSRPVDEHSRNIDKHSAKLVASVAAAVTAAEEMMKAIDAKCGVSEPMRNRKKKFEGLLRRMAELLDPCEHHASAVGKAWGDTKKQVDE